MCIVQNALMSSTTKLKLNEVTQIARCLKYTKYTLVGGFLLIQKVKIDFKINHGSIHIKKVIILLVLIQD